MLPLTDGSGEGDAQGPRPAQIEHPQAAGNGATGQGAQKLAGGGYHTLPPDRAAVASAARGYSAEPLAAQIGRIAPLPAADGSGDIRLAPGPEESAAIEKLFQALPEGFRDEDFALVLRAYVLASHAHRNQRRESDEPYILHPIAVAQILVGLGMDPVCVAAGLLHDVAEDTEYTVEYIREHFGEAIASLVDGVTKLKRINEMGSARAGIANHKAESLRKMFIAMVDDVRVVLIKLADRLHNMRTLGSQKEHKRRRIARETLEIFAPLANRLGIWPIKSELEDLAFRYLEPATYKDLMKAVSQKQPERDKLGIMARVELERELAKAGIPAEVSGRPKHVYSIYRKMRRKAVSFDQIYDVLALRVIVESEAQCYAALGVVHSIWRPIPGEFDDYIASPKNNMYRSLHTGVLSNRSGRPMEIQIRTREMHHEAEFGIAAHWQYKEQPNKGQQERKQGKKKQGKGEQSKGEQQEELQPGDQEGEQKAEQKGQQKEQKEQQKEQQESARSSEQFINKKINVMRHWMRQVMEWRNEVTDAEEFVDGVKNDMFKEHVFIFTPHGDIVDLPAGSTPIDFAYTIHTDLGHRCRGASVNGKLVPLDYKLQNSDQVQILSAKRGGPSRDWLNPNLEYVATQRARSKIRGWLKKQDRNENIQRGRQILERELKRLSSTISFEELSRLFNYDKVDDFLAAIGFGEVNSQQIAQKLIEQEQRDRAIQSFDKMFAGAGPGERASDRIPGRHGDELRVQGVGGVLTNLARCCDPVPGDVIVGYVTRGRGVTIHRANCPNMVAALRKGGESRLIDVRWAATTEKTYPVKISISAYDRYGLVRDIAGMVADEKINMRSVEALTGQKNNLAVITATLEIEDAAQLLRILTKIDNLSSVVEAHRVLS